MQKATYNFTTLIGQGAFGPVYKAQMSTGETVAVKVLATNSKQGEKEFQTEVKIIISHYFEMHRRDSKNKAKGEAEATEIEPPREFRLEE